MIRNKVVRFKLNLILKCFFIVAAFFHNFGKNTIRNLFVDAESLFVNIDILINVNHAV